MILQIWKPLIYAIVFVACLAIFAPLASAQSSEVNRLLDLLVRKNVITQEEAATLREELAADKVVHETQVAAAKEAQAVAPREQPVTASRAMRLSGWTQARFSDSTGARNSLEIRRARLDLRGNLTEKTLWRAQIDMVRSPVLLDAYVEFQQFSRARLRVGQFKIPFSHENLTSSRDMITAERSLAVLALVPGRDNNQNGRDIGLMAEGSFVRSDGRPLFDYSVGLFNGAGINTRDNNHRKDAAVRVLAHLTRNLKFIGNYYHGESGAAQADKERAAFEFVFATNNFDAQGVYIWGRDGSTHRRGSSTLLAYKFHKRWQGVFQFSELDSDTHAGNDETRNYLFGVNWLFNSYVKWQSNYIAADMPLGSRLNHQFLTQLVFAF
jgi:hypothetical protein